MARNVSEIDLELVRDGVALCDRCTQHPWEIGLTCFHIALRMKVTWMQNDTAMYSAFIRYCQIEPPLVVESSARYFIWKANNPMNRKSGTNLRRNTRNQNRDISGEVRQISCNSYIENCWKTIDLIRYSEKHIIVHKQKSHWVKRLARNYVQI